MQKKAKLTPSQRKEEKQKKRAELEAVTIKPNKRKLNEDTAPLEEDHFEAAQEGYFKKMEVMDYPYDSFTIRQVVEIVHITERVNVGSLMLYRVLWDVVKYNFSKMGGDELLMFLQSLCESNLNLGYFEGEMREVFERVYVRGEKMGFRDDGGDGLSGGEVEGVNPVVMVFDMVYGER